MKKFLMTLLVVGLVVLTGCKKNQVVDAPGGPPISESAAPTEESPVEVIDVPFVSDDGYVNEADEDMLEVSVDQYEVRRGDTLWSIAKRVYGDGKRWRDIASANGISNPRRLRVGQSLVIP